MTTTVLTIKGEKYSIDLVPPNPLSKYGCIQLVCITSDADSLLRNYVLRLGSEGLPVDCTCPAYVYGEHKMCKHVLAVRDHLAGK